MKKIIVTMLGAFLLQGCVAGAFVAGGTTATSMVTDNRTLETMAADNKITYQAELHMSADPVLENSHIVVETYNRVVLLAGEVATPALRDKAVKIVQGVDGPRRIFNEITIGKPISAITRSKDLATTTNVKTKLLTTSGIRSSQFRVVTENGTVYLMGLSTRKQANLAALKIRDLSGVKRVVKLVEYVNDDGDDVTQ